MILCIINVFLPKCVTEVSVGCGSSLLVCQLVSLSAFWLVSVLACLFVSLLAFRFVTMLVCWLVSLFAC